MSGNRSGNSPGNDSKALLARLNRLHPKKIDLSLGRVERLLARLGNPQQALPPVVHIAGTNGKGSTLAFLRAMTEAAGASVHCYTSPHLVRFHERIRLAGSLIGEDHLAALLAECEAANGDSPITFFEITTAMAFLAFSRCPADLLLLETGLGGRLDATNMVDPVLTVITPISVDHQQFLGDSLPGIAAEKAGIIKSGRPVLIGPQPDEVMAVLEDIAAQRGASVYRTGRDWHFREGHNDGSSSQLMWQADNQLLADYPAGCAEISAAVLPALSLSGLFQKQNAALALACLPLLQNTVAAGGDVADIDISEAVQGLAQAEWPARMQRIGEGALRDILPAEADLWLDGGHNPAGGRALRKALADQDDDRMLYVIVGMMGGKDAAGFLDPLFPLVQWLCAVPIAGEDGAMAPDDLASQAQTLGYAPSRAGSVEEALQRIARSGDPAPRVLVCGSLHLAGEFLAKNQTPIM